ncbi:bacillithiol biosynthesis cysteine-adding enzyme BshC [Psychrobacillus vulpis]|uniref:bacillithiol biosynthesis cysteine-adding enzyme BshC n=1 Tax=Psychrobacillus vulpis TaxID=2325572 RepID=UPI00140BD572|nr:bacillithiol biosynthesis cysteine-adding enzyme BshC [Psychrobacillus vulpis]
MRLEKHTQPFASSFYKKYLEDTASLSSFFHYEWNQTALQNRLQETDFSKHKRSELVNVLTNYMSKFGISEKSKKHLEELKDNGIIIIGGQQAGIITGPMYSIHKAISVITLAKQQREKLGVPVIPVFWIAGEDHDIDEINHVYIERGRKLQKVVYPEVSKIKQMASVTKFDNELMSGYMEELFQSLPETLYTKELFSKINNLLENNLTYSDFFAAMMNDLFQEEGLLFIDAAYEPFRKLESEYFQKMVKQSSELAKIVFENEKAFEQSGFGMPIQAKENAAHLFYVENGERFLLERKDNKFVHEAKGISFSEDELMEIAISYPEKLSNNVVTRPLMQEMVFPVLSFIGGPGEIAYWGILKNAFELFDMKMPVIMPRLSISIVNIKTQTLLEKFSFSVPDIWDGAVEAAKLQYINDNRNEKVPALIDSIKQQLVVKYTELDELLQSDDIKLSPLVEKNLRYHENQLKYIQNAIEDNFIGKLDASIHRYDRMIMELTPNGGLQERTYSPLQLLNEVGPNLVNQLLELPYEFNGKHHIAFL